MNKNKNKNKPARTIVVTEDHADPARLVVELRPSDGSPKSRRPVHAQDEVLRFAREHAVAEKTIDWNGLQDRLPAHKAKAAATQR
ncbi:hypothetical protein [Kitasatospora herbaricolor]|uniref:Lsr2 protein n=1 Tax=Kitasatospora herbaricolor TaxID=68217 RepID=A0ABZ1W2A3_9ACTN|nr:hypothetical protein [Kitasatospora herbaricolor]